MEQIAITYGDLIENNEILTLMSKKNILEIIKTVQKSVKYLTNYTLVFLQKINGKWYVN